MSGLSPEAGGGRPDERRLEALRRLPREVLDRLSREEVKIFLHEDDWPDSLREKLENYLVGVDEPS
jgi:hypothetical protein